MMPSLAALRVRLLALWKLLRHPETPWPVRAVAVLVFAYAVSPIDLVPDFIPVLGLVDDLLLLPLGLWLVVRLAPRELWQRCLAEAEAEDRPGALPKWAAGRWLGAAIVVGLWLALLAAAGWGIMEWIQAGG